MGLMETIDAAANRDIGLIRQNTSAKCESILKNAEKEVARILSENAQTAENEKEKIITSSDSDARLRAAADEGRALERILDEFRETVFTSLDHEWKSGFSDVFADICVFGSRAIGSSEIRVSLVPEYRKLYESSGETIKKKLSAHGIEVSEVSFDLRARGGAVIRRPDGRRIRTETFEESFRRIEDDIRTELIGKFRHE